MEDIVATAMAFVDLHFLGCDTALLAGSLVRGEPTTTSDLDIVVLTRKEAVPYRESFIWQGWPVEAFVHDEQSLLDFFGRDALRRRPSLQQMCSEGIVLRNRDGLAERIKEEARRQLLQGPEPLTQEEMERLRYTATDLLDDFYGSTRQVEAYFVAHDLAEIAVRLILLPNRCWLGSGKWITRALRAYDPEVAGELTDALADFYRSGEKDRLGAFAEGALAQAGGRLFEGYRSPRKPKGQK